MTSRSIIRTASTPRPLRALHRARARAALAALALSLGALALPPPALAAGAPPAPPRWLGAAAPAPVPLGGAPRVPPARASFAGFADVQVNVDPGNTVEEFGPAVAVGPNGSVHVVWTGDETQKTVWYARSTDGGQTFSTPVRINDAVAYPPSYSVYQPDVAVAPNGTVDVVWHDYRAWASDYDYGSRIDVYLDRSTDGGTTWGTDVRVTNEASGTYPWHFQPYLAVDPVSGTLYVSFTSYDRYLPEGDPSDVFVVRSTDGGATFGTRVRVDDLPDAALVAQGFSAIATAPDGSVVVAFEDARGTSDDIRIARSVDAGLTFGANALVNADTTGIQEEPSIAVDTHGAVHAVWHDWSQDSDPSTAPFLDQVRYARTGAGGGAFGPSVQVTDVAMNGDHAFQWPPRLAVDGAGIVHVVWFDERTGRAFCYYDRSLDGGRTFGTDQVLSANRDSVVHELPRIALMGWNAPCAVWMDARNGSGNADIFFTRERAVTAVGTGGSPGALRLAGYPNPSAGPTSVGFTLPRDVRTRVEIRDLAGRLVRGLAEGPMAAGAHALAWDGFDAAGRPAPAGAYWILVDAGGTCGVTRIALLR